MIWLFVCERGSNSKAVVSVMRAVMLWSCALWPLCAVALWLLPLLRSQTLYDGLAFFTGVLWWVKEAAERLCVYLPCLMWLDKHAVSPIIPLAQIKHKGKRCLKI